MQKCTKITQTVVQRVRLCVGVCVGTTASGCKCPNESSGIAMLPPSLLPPLDGTQHWFDWF